jgi:hypothetical protein
MPRNSNHFLALGIVGYELAGNSEPVFMPIRYENQPSFPLGYL